MKRDEALLVLKELFDVGTGIDERSFELTPPNTMSSADGYEIIIKGSLDEETKRHIQNIVTKHQLAYQTGSIWKTKRSINKTEPDTFIIYTPPPKSTA